MVEQRCQPTSIVLSVDQAKSDRIGQDLRIVIAGLVERPHDRRNFDGPASLGLFHHSLKREDRTWQRERIEECSARKRGECDASFSRLLGLERGQ
jgi:hypothetical protein